MGRIGNCQAAWCGLGFLFLSACTDDFEKSLSAEAKELMAVMDQTEISCSNSVQMVDAWLEINKAAKNLTDLSERTYIVNRLGQFVLTVDLMGKNEYQKRR